MRTSDICPTCSTFENALCIIYNGTFLTTLDINTLDSLEDALIKIEVFALAGVPGSSIITQDEGSVVGTTTAILNFVGGGVIATDAGGNITTVTINPTALSTGTITAITYGITSDGGVDDLILVEATTSVAGLLGAAKWDEIVANTAKVGFLNLTGHITSSGPATLLGSFTLAQLDTALGTTGTADATTFLQGDNSWATLDQSITNDTTTTYNFVLVDTNNIVTLDNAAAVAAILPANGTIAIPVGSKIRVFNKGAGVVTLSVTTDTINTGTGGLTMAQYDTRLLHKIAATEWIVGF